MTTDVPSPLASLRRYAQRRAEWAQCELCSAGLADHHSHLLELEARRLCCACEACAVLFSDPAAGKYRRVPRRAEYLPGFRLSALAWEGLQLPINLAFFVPSSAAGRVVAYYPSPGGATEALPPPGAWETLAEDNPFLHRLTPDVEALLVNRLPTEPEHFLVGIDECYALVGVVRKHWRGMSGGPVWLEVARFFAGLKARSPGGTPDA